MECMLQSGSGDGSGDAREEPTHTIFFFFLLSIITAFSEKGESSELPCRLVKCYPHQLAGETTVEEN